MSNELIESLKNPAIYPHVASGIEVIETHLSWVILTGPFAYKVKKPLALGFQDFTTLDKRKKFCELEVEFNQPLAAPIYLEAIAIYGTPSQPSFIEKGPVLEYAVKMHEFPQENLLRAFAQKKKLSTKHVESIANTLANFHQQATIAPSSTSYGSADDIFSAANDNCQALKTLASTKQYLETVEAIEQWTKATFASLQAFMTLRKEQGFVRACHGDLHLGNIVMLKNEPVIFDCIEFNEGFRYTDVLNDVAFLAMDLDHLGASTLGYQFVNRYMELTQDYAGLKLLRFYQCYRAMVRAKVTAMLIEQLDTQSPQQATLQQHLAEFLALAKRYTQPEKTELMIMMGPSGSGKTLFSSDLITKTGAIRLRSDIIRKHLHGMAPIAKSTPSQKEQLYSEASTKALYLHLQALANDLIGHHYSVIIDATCLQEWQRTLFHEVAKKHQVDYKIYLFICQIDVLEQRILNRASLGDPSEADLSVLVKQLDEAEPLNDDEEAFTTFIPADFIDDLIDSKDQPHA